MDYYYVHATDCHTAYYHSLYEKVGILYDIVESHQTQLWLDISFSCLLSRYNCLQNILGFSPQKEDNVNS